MYEITYTRNGNWYKFYAYISAACAQDAQNALKANEPGLDGILSTVKVAEGTVIFLR